MKVVDLETIYIRGENGFVPCSASPNFGGGTKTCEHCNSPMERTPLGTPFKRSGNGKILLAVSQMDGRMIKSNIKPEWSWFCTGCKLAVTPKSK